MKFREFDTVRVTSDENKEVKKGEIGTVLMGFETPEEAYEVEFLDEKGMPRVQCTLLPHELERVSPG